MANELTLNIKLSYSKGSNTLSRTESDTVTITGTNFARVIQDIGTSEEAVTVPADIATVGYVFAKNLDATNYIEFGTTGKLINKLKAGESALVRVNGALYAQANTLSCQAEFIVIED